MFKRDSRESLQLRDNDRMVEFRIIMIVLVSLLNTSVSKCFPVRAKSQSLVEMRRLSLQKTKKSNSTKKKHGSIKHMQQTDISLSKSYLLDVIDEAFYRQESAIEALDREVERQRIQQQLDYTKRERIEARRNELSIISIKLTKIQSSLHTRQLDKESMEQMKQQICKLGYASIFKQRQSSWKSNESKEKEFGRPFGFDGQLYYSPLGVPILVGRMNAHKDDIMRNAANGADLWFQVEDYNGSRVLLRTSLMRGTMNSKKCKQMAADLAAKFSVWGDHRYESIPVIYTDSRKVAKRGTKVGSMKKSKSLGRMMGYPKNV